MIFTALIAMLPAGAGWGSVTVFGLSPAISAAIISAGQSVLWSLAGAALTKPNVPRQQVQATISQTDAPRIRCYGRNLLGGQRAFYEAHNSRLHQIVVCHHGRLNGLVKVWIDGEPVTLGETPAGVDGGGRVGRYLAVYFRNGSGNGGDYAGVFNSGDSGNDLDWPDPTEAFPTLWTSSHRLQGQATFYAVFGDPSDEDFAKVFPKGAYTVVQAEVRGSHVLNMAGASVYSENAGLCIRDLMTNADGWNIPLVRLDSASWQAFVSRCDQPVPLAAGGTEPRYRLCGFYSLDDALKDVTARMLATCDGQIYETADGKIGILGGAWSDPDVTITADDILSIEMQDGYDPFTDYNVLKGSFVSPAHGYQPTEVEEIRDAAALVTQEERVEQFDNDMVPASGQMQRLMKIKMAKDRRAQTGTIRTNLVGMKARFPKGDGIHTIRVRADEFGLDGVFEVTSHSFDIPGGVCEIGIASIDNPYGWTAAEERPLPPGVADLGTPDNAPPAFTGVALTQQIVTVSGGVKGVKLALSVSNPGRESLALQAQLAQGNHAAGSTSATWVDMAVAGYRAESGILDDTNEYTVRYRWRGRGDWLNKIGPVTVVANPTVPAAPGSFKAVASGGMVALDWVNAPSEYFRTRIYRNTTNSFATASLVATVAGSPGQVSGHNDTPGGTGTRYYWAVTINASFVPSSPSGPKSVTL